MSNTPINVCGYPEIADTAGAKPKTWLHARPYGHAAPPAPSVADAASASEGQEPRHHSPNPMEKDMAMTVEEALQRAADLEKQGCITPTAQALLALAKAYQDTMKDKLPKA